MKVAVVILNWNGKGFLQKFLPSLFNSLPEYADLTVADNASTDGSKETFNGICNSLKGGRNQEAATPELNWIQLDRNYGFTGGYNRAFNIIRNSAAHTASPEENSSNSASSPYKYYVLINSDILVTGNWLQPLVNFMEEHPEVAVCQPKILSYARHLKVVQEPLIAEQFEYAGAAGGFIDRWGFPFCRGRILSCLEEDLGQYDNPQRCFWASGACMIVRSSIWHKLQGLEEKFFAHMEEIDFCWRASLAGYEVWCLPQSKVYHVGGGTLPNNSPRKLYFNYRNNLLMLWKNLPKRHKNAKIFLRKCIDGLSAVCYVFQGKFSYFKSVVKAHRHYTKLKKEVAVSPQQQPSPTPQPTSSVARPFGMLPFSIILKFFTGKKKFSQLPQN